MDNTSGALSFDAVVNETDFNESVNDMERRIKGFASSTEKAGDQMDAAFKKIYKGVEDFTSVTSENLQIQRNVIKEIESNLKTIKDRLENVGPGKARMEVAAQYRELNAELEREKQALYDLEIAVKENEAAHASLYGQLRKIRDEMATMEASGQRNTEQYSQMQQEAARLTEALADVNRQTRIIGSSGALFQGIISGLGGVAGAFSAAQGTAGLFARENENLQKIMLRVQSLLAITIGLQQVQQALDKDQAFMLVVVRRAKDALTASTYKLATALGVSNVAAKVLMGTLTLGLSVAIGVLISAWEKYSSAQRRAREQDQKFNEAVAENAYKTIAVFKQLQANYTALGDDMQSKEKYIKSNQEQFKKLGIEVRNVADAENLLIANANAFQDTIILKAKSVAAMELASEAYKESMKKMMDADEEYKTSMEIKAPSIWTHPMEYGATGMVQGMKSKSYEKEVFDAEEVAKRGNEYIKQVEEFNSEIEAIYKQFGFKILPDEDKQKKEKDVFIENLNAIKAQYDLYIKWINSKDRFLQETARYQFSSLLQGGKSYLEYLTQERDALLSISNRTKEQEENLRKLNDAIAELSKIPVIKDETGDLFTKSLNKKKTEYDRFLSWIGSTDTILQDSARKEFAGLLTEGENYLEFLTRQRDALLAKTSRTKTDDSLIVKYNNEIAQVTKGTVLDDFQEKLKQQVEAATSVLEVIQLIEAEKNKITGTTDLEKEQQAILDKAMQDALKRSKDETQTLLHDYAGYLGQKIDFEKNYLNNKQLLTIAISKATNDQELQLAKASMEELEAERERWKKSSGDLELDNLAAEYMSIEDQRVAAKEKANKEIKKLLDAELFYEAIARGKALKQQLAQLDEQKPEVKEAMEALSIEYANASADLIKLVIQQIEAIPLGGVTKETIAQITDALEAAKKTLSARDFFDFSYIRKERKEVETETNPNKKLQDRIDLQEAVNQKIDEGVWAAQELLGSIQSQNEELNRSLGLLSRMVGMFGQFAKKDFFGGIVSFISTIITIFSRTAAENQALEEEVLQKTMDNMSKMLANLMDLFDQTDKMIDRVFGVDRINAFKDAIKVAGENLNKIITNLNVLARNAGIELPENLISGVGGITFGGTKLPMPDMTSLNDYMQALEANQKTIAFLQKYLKDNYFILDEYTRTGLEENLAAYEDYYTELEQKKAEYQEYLTGSTVESITSGLMEGFEDGFVSAEEFADDFEGLMKKAILNSLKTLVLSPMIQKWMENFAADMESGGGLDKAEMEALEAEYLGIVDTANAWMKAMDDMGIDWGRLTGSQDQLTGAIKGVSEETASLVAGQMNAIRLNQAQSLSLMREHLMALSAIRSNTDVLPQTMPESLIHLRNIDNNISSSYSLFTGTGIKVRF